MSIKNCLTSLLSAFFFSDSPPHDPDHLLVFFLPVVGHLARLIACLNVRQRALIAPELLWCGLILISLDELFKHLTQEQQSHLLPCFQNYKAGMQHLLNLKGLPELSSHTIFSCDQGAVQGGGSMPENFARSLAPDPEDDMEKMLAGFDGDFDFTALFGESDAKAVDGSKLEVFADSPSSVLGLR